MSKLIRFVLKGLIVILVPTTCGLFLSALVLANTALFSVANDALARIGVETASSALEQKVRAQVVREERLARQKVKIANRKAATEIRSKAIQKATTSAKRNIASMPLEAVPFLGVATVITVTAWEINDLCEIMIFIDQLGSLYDPEITPDETTEACKSLQNEVKKIGGEIDEAASKLQLESDVGELEKHYNLDGEAASTETPQKSAVEGVYKESINIVSRYYERAAKYYGWDKE